MTYQEDAGQEDAGQEDAGQEDAGQEDAGSREKDRLDKEGHVAKAVALTVDVISPPSSRPPHR